MGQVATSSAKMATFNSSDEMFDISGASGNSNNTGMVSGSERVRRQMFVSNIADLKPGGWGRGTPGLKYRGCSSEMLKNPLKDNGKFINGRCFAICYHT